MHGKSSEAAAVSVNSAQIRYGGNETHVCGDSQSSWS